VSPARAHDLVEAARTWCSAVAEPVLSVLFPPRCVGCGDFESHLCATCRRSLDAIGPDCCPRCGEPGPVPLVGGRCAHCMAAEFSYSRARAAFRHVGTARRLVAEFKFGGQPVLGREMAAVARPMFVDLLSTAGSPDRLVITWVPCHRAAQRRRGYNQAEVLARALAGGPQLLRREALVRKTRTTKHQKGLDRSGRQANLAGAFALDKVAVSRLPRETAAIVLVDDVYTTGATAREVSSVLVSGIGIPVHVFTFSRAVSGTTERHD
jgi:competence protein ComFC